MSLNEINETLESRRIRVWAHDTLYLYFYILMCFSHNLKLIKHSCKWHFCAINAISALTLYPLFDDSVHELNYSCLAGMKYRKCVLSELLQPRCCSWSLVIGWCPVVLSCSPPRCVDAPASICWCAPCSVSGLQWFSSTAGHTNGQISCQ